MSARTESGLILERLAVKGRGPFPLASLGHDQSLIDQSLELRLDTFGLFARPKPEEGHHDAESQSEREHHRCYGHGNPIAAQGLAKHVPGAVSLGVDRLALEVVLDVAGQGFG